PIASSSLSTSETRDLLILAISAMSDSLILALSNPHPRVRRATASSTAALEPRKVGEMHAASRSLGICVKPPASLRCGNLITLVLVAVLAPLLELIPGYGLPPNRGFSLPTAGPLRDSQPLGRPASRTRFPHRVLGRPLGRHLRRLATLSPRLFAHEADQRLEIV